MNRLSSRSTSALTVGVLALALAVTGCGSEADDDADNETADIAPPVCAEATTDISDTTIGTKFGDVAIPTAPERVVALGWGDAETALALGVQPVGAADWLGFGAEVDGVGPWAEGLYDTSPEILGTMELDVEAVAALDPDLILDTKGSGDQARYDSLSKIAPVIGIPEGADNYLTTTEQQTAMVAAALGKVEEGQVLLDGVDEAFAAAADDNPDFEGTSVTVSAYSSDGWGVYSRCDARVQFMENLGLQQSAAVAAQESDNFFEPVSDENLDLLDADVMVSFPIFVEASEITDQELYQALPAVQDDRAVVIDDLTLGNAYSLGTTLALEYAIENVVPLLEGPVAAS